MKYFRLKLTKLKLYSHLRLLWGWRSEKDKAEGKKSCFFLIINTTIVCFEFCLFFSDKALTLLQSSLKQDLFPEIIPNWFSYFFSLREIYMSWMINFVICSCQAALKQFSDLYTYFLSSPMAGDDIRILSLNNLFISWIKLGEVESEASFWRSLFCTEPVFLLWSICAFI